MTAGDEKAGTGDEELAMVLESAVDLAEDDATWMLGKNVSPSPSSSDVVVSEVISLIVDRDVSARLGVATLMVDEEGPVRRRPETELGAEGTLDEEVDVARSRPGADLEADETLREESGAVSLPLAAGVEVVGGEEARASTRSVSDEELYEGESGSEGVPEIVLKGLSLPMSLAKEDDMMTDVFADYSLM